MKLAAGAQCQHLLGTHSGRLFESDFADVVRNQWVFDERQHASAAVGILMVVGHFDKLDVRDRLDHVPWWFVYSRDAADMA